MGQNTKGTVWRMFREKNEGLFTVTFTKYLKGKASESCPRSQRQGWLSGKTRGKRGVYVKQPYPGIVNPT